MSAEKAPCVFSRERLGLAGKRECQRGADDSRGEDEGQCPAHQVDTKNIGQHFDLQRQNKNVEITLRSFDTSVAYKRRVQVSILNVLNINPLYIASEL